MSVHAHPDDEASKGAPTIAKYSAAGHETFLVCCTGGEEGEVINKAMDRPEIHANLPAVRVAELERSVKAIGFSHLDWLGYRDSGMEGTEANENPECFWQADLDEATGRLVALIRRHRPHAIITYSDNQQGYRHPDHLRVHDISVLAFDRAGDPAWYPEAGEPWQPLKLYYSLWSMARMLAYHELYGRLGMESPYKEDWFERESQGPSHHHPDRCHRVLRCSPGGPSGSRDPGRPHRVVLVRVARRRGDGRLSLRGLHPGPIAGRGGTPGSRPAGRGRRGGGGPDGSTVRRMGPGSDRRVGPPHPTIRSATVPGSSS